MFRESFKNEIIKILSKDNFFSIYDFTIQENDKNKEIIEITYNPDIQYFFHFEIPTILSNIKTDYGSEQHYLYSSEIAPWEAAKIEKKTFRDKKAFLEGLAKWLCFLREDLLSTPVNRKIQEMESKLDEFSQFIDKLEGEYFCADEANSLRQKIDDIEKDLILNINELNKKNDEKESMINDLKDEVNGLKSKIDILDKKGMFKSIAGMMLHWGAKPENQKMLGDGVKIVQGLIENTAK